MLYLQTYVRQPIPTPFKKPERSLQDVKSLTDIYIARCMVQAGATVYGIDQVVACAASKSASIRSGQVRNRSLSAR